MYFERGVSLGKGVPGVFLLTQLTIEDFRCLLFFNEDGGIKTQTYYGEEEADDDDDDDENMRWGSGSSLSIKQVWVGYAGWLVGLAVMVGYGRLKMF